MKRLIVLAVLFAAGPACAGAPASPEAHVAPLDRLVGTWTIEGREGSYRETCDWYPGGHHVVCHAESKRKDGSVSHSMSILAHAEGQGFVYTGIGASGRYETFRNGVFENGVLEYTDRGAEGTVRVRVGPFTDPDVLPFNVHISQDGKEWTPADSFNYVRLK